jgi:hypothetical protein
MQHADVLLGVDVHLRLAPTTIEQCRCCGDLVPRILQCGDQRLDGCRCVFARQRLHIDHGFGPATWIATAAWRERPPDDTH